MRWPAPSYWRARRAARYPRSTTGEAGSAGSTATCSSGSGSPARISASRRKVSGGESAPTRTSASAARARRTPGRPRQRASTSDSPGTVATGSARPVGVHGGRTRWSPAAMSQSTSWGRSIPARSNQVRAAVVTRWPSGSSSAWSEGSRTRWLTTPPRSVRCVRAERSKVRCSPAGRARRGGSGSPCQRAAETWETTPPVRRTSAAAPSGAHGSGTPAVCTPRQIRARSAARVRRHGRPAACSSAVVKAPAARVDGRGVRAVMGRACRPRTLRRAEPTRPGEGRRRRGGCAGAAGPPDTVAPARRGLSYHGCKPPGPAITQPALRGAAGPSVTACGPRAPAPRPRAARPAPPPASGCTPAAAAGPCRSRG